jgi:hypothetical protein
MSSNYNEQYSRKNNIKVFNFPRREKLFTSLLNKRTIKGLGSCSAGSLCIATTSLSSKVTFRSRLTKLIKSWRRFCLSLLGKLNTLILFFLEWGKEGTERKSEICGWRHTKEHGAHQKTRTKSAFRPGVVL